MIFVEIVLEFDKYIIGQVKVKKVVVVVLCNCWCCQQVVELLCQEIMLKNILMIGLMGVGKIEIVCCFVKFVDVLFIKIEVIKFIEVGYVGCDVDSIVCDLIEILVKQMCEVEMCKVCSKVIDQVEDCIFDILLL